MLIEWKIEERVLSYHGTLRPGGIYDLPPEVANSLIRQGSAVKAKQSRSAKEKMIDETPTLIINTQSDNQED